MIGKILCIFNIHTRNKKKDIYWDYDYKKEKHYLYSYCKYCNQLIYKYLNGIIWKELK